MKKLLLALVVALGVANVQAAEVAPATAPKKGVLSKFAAMAKAHPAKATAALAVATYFSLYGLNATAKYFNKCDGATKWMDSHLFNPVFGKKYTTKDIPVYAWFDKAENGTVAFSDEKAKAAAEKSADVTKAADAVKAAKADADKAAAGEAVTKAADDNEALKKLNAVWEAAYNAVPEKQPSKRDKDAAAAYQAAVKANADAEKAFEAARAKFVAEHAEVVKFTNAHKDAVAKQTAEFNKAKAAALEAFLKTDEGKKAVKLMLHKDGNKSAAKVEDAQTTKEDVNGFAVNHPYMTVATVATAVALFDVIDRGWESVLGKLAKLVAGSVKKKSAAVAA